MTREVAQRVQLVAVGILLFLVGFLGASPTLGTTFRTGTDVVIGADEVIDDDLYAAGETVTIDGTVTGDVVAGGSSVTLNGSVGGDLIGAAQAVLIEGTVGDDVRVAGMVVKLGPNARIGDDLVVAGYSLESEAGSRAEGGLFFAGYQARLAGGITEGFKGAMAGLELLGSVGGDVEVEVEGGGAGPSPARFFPSPISIPVVAPGLTVVDTAEVGGTFTYTSSADGRIDPGAQVQGGVTHKEPQADPVKAPTVQDRVLKHLRQLIALVVVGLLVLWIAPSWTGRLADRISAKPLASLGWGALSLGAFVVGVLAFALGAILIAVLVGFLTLGKLVGLVIALGLFAEATWVTAFWLAASFMAPIVVGLVLGKWLLKRTLPDRAAGRALPLIVGLVVLALLRAVPFLGPLVGFVVMLLGLGVLCIWGVAACRPPAQEPVPAG